MITNIRDCGSSVQANKFPHNPKLWPYNWVPRIPCSRRIRGNNVYAWHNSGNGVINQQKESLKSVTLSPDSVPINPFTP